MNNWSVFFLSVIFTAAIIYSKVHVFRIDLQGQKETSFSESEKVVCDKKEADKSSVQNAQPVK